MAVAATGSGRVVIVGAGVIGLMTALQLHRRGLAVTVLDRGRAGQESSWAGGGILSPILPWDYPEPIWRLSRRSRALYGALAAELRETTGIDPELTPCGTIALPGENGFGLALRWLAQEGLPGDAWRGSLVPGADERQGLWLPWIGHIRNPRLVKALAARLRQLDGVELIEDCAVSGLLHGDGRVTGVQTASGDIAADTVVICGGAWSGQLLAGLGAPLPIEPVRGQMLVYATEPGWLPHIVMRQGRYLIPRRDGRILVGSTVERAGFDKTPTAEVGQSLADFAAELLPPLAAQQPEHHWVGLRPGSMADELPYIGAHPATAGLYVNAGHYRNGLVMAPASAELLADLLTGTAPTIDPLSYRLERSSPQD